MAMRLSSSLLKEERLLLQELRQSAIYQKLIELHKLLRMYSIEPSPIIPEGEGDMDTLLTGVHNHRRRGSKAAQIVIASIRYLRNHGKRATAYEITNFLRQQGMVIGNSKTSFNKATGMVANCLDASVLFTYLPLLGGYGLKEWDDKGDPTYE